MAKKGVLQFLNSDGTYSDAYPKTSYDKVEGLDDHVKTIKVSNAATADMATGNAGTATKLATAHTIALSGGATGTATSFDGSANISIPVTSLDASKLTGTAAVNTTGTATRATNDKNGKDLTTYLKSISFAFPTLTVTTGAGATSMYLLVPDGAGPHNALYRGKDLTAYFDSGEMSKAIAAGTFRDIFPGDYINKAMTVNGTSIGMVKWLVADLDYWLYGGDNAILTAHHAVMIPEDVLDVNIRMNASNDTTGAYLGSEMWKTTLPLYTTAIQSAFGSDHVLSHREWLTSVITADLTNATGLGWTGASTDGTWIDVPGANLMNEVMVYGYAVYSSSSYDNASCVDQLALFSLDHKARIAGYRGNRTNRKWWWLRAVASASRFCGAGGGGDAGCGDAAVQNAWGGLRPYFLLR